jgi:hypothetical protein
MNDSNHSTGGQSLDEILAEYLRALEAGTAPSAEELIARNPEIADQLRDFFSDMRSCEDWENEGGALRTDP